MRTCTWGASLSFWLVVSCTTAAPKKEAVVVAEVSSPIGAIAAQLAPGHGPPSALPALPHVTPPVSERTLANGLRVVVVEQHRRPVVALRLIFPRGSTGDPEGEEGLSYLAVALASDYYEKGPEGEELSEEKSFRRRCGDSGGTCSFEVHSDHSTITIAGYARDTPTYLDLVRQAVLSVRHGHESFMARRDATVDAIEDLDRADSDTFGLFLGQAAFGLGHPYSRPVFGNVTSVTNLPHEDLVTVQRKIFTPRGATLLVVGDVTGAAIFAQAQKALARWEGAAFPSPAVEAPQVTRKPDVGFIKREPTSTLVVCATRPLSDVKGDDAALELLAAIVGRGINSRLSGALRETHALTYSVNADIIRRRHARAFIACSHLRSETSPLGLQVFSETLETARLAPFTDQEILRARGVQLAELESAYDDLPSTLSTYSEALALGLPLKQLETRRAEMEKVTAADLKRVAAKVLDRNTLRWIVSGEHLPARKAVEKNGFGSMKELYLVR